MPNQIPSIKKTCKGTPKDRSLGPRQLAYANTNLLVHVTKKTKIAIKTYFVRQGWNIANYDDVDKYLKLHYIKMGLKD